MHQEILGFHEDGINEFLHFLPGSLKNHREWIIKPQECPCPSLGVAKETDLAMATEGGLACVKNLPVKHCLRFST
jgi:hypothetical protein